MDDALFEITIKRSRYLAAYLLTVHLLAFATLAVTGVVWLTTASALLLSISLLYYLRQFYFAQPDRQLRLVSDNRWQLASATTDTTGQFVLQRCYESQFLLIMVMKAENSRRTVKLVMAVDALSADDYRRLRRRLRDERIYPN